MTTKPDKSTTPKSFRRWFRVSLRTMLVLMAVVCLAVGWWGNVVQRERQARKGIEENGGLLLNSYPGRTIYLPTRISEFLGFDLFEYDLSVSCNSFHTPINFDLILLNCRGLSNLKSIEMSQTDVSDLGINHIRGHRSLEILCVSDCERITDASSSVFLEVSRLQWLDLRGTKITKASVPLLSKLKRLRRLHLSRSDFSDEDKKTITQSLSKTEVYFDGVKF